MSSDNEINNNVCQSTVFGSIGVDIIVPGAGSFLLGVTRICSCAFLLANNFWNRRRLKKYEENNLDIARGLVLPSYFPCIYSLMAIDAISGLFDIILSSKNIPERNRLRAYAWLLPIECGIFHSIFEGLAIFTLMYGAGRSSFRYSLKYAMIWGLITTAVFFTEFRLIFDVDDGTFYEENTLAAYTIFVIYNAVLLCFYLCILLIPNDILYKRPAATPYAIFNIILVLFWILMASVIRYDQMSDICGFSIAGLILIALIQPLAVWFTLMRDSQYWQGLCPDKGNPLSTVWDQIDVKTALGMSDVLTSYERDKKSKLKLLHFGLISLDNQVGFIAGGFSRVYFGQLRNEAVALKVMFAMELTAKDISEFFHEAKILQDLVHENIVGCKGVCVMPPAVAIVLERCAFGSLFDFLYKNRTFDDFSSSASQSFIQTNPSILLPYHSQSSASALAGTGGSERTSTISRPTYGDRGWGTSTQTLDDNDTIGAVDNPLAVMSNPRHSLTSSHSAIAVMDIQKASEKRSSMVRFSLQEESSHSSPYQLRPTYRASESSSNRGSSSSTKKRLAWASRRFNNFILSGFSFGKNNLKTGGIGVDPVSMSMPAAYRLTNTMRHKMMLDVIRALTHVHALGYIHSDIKSLNFLVTEDFRVKLSDMGETRHIDDPPKRDGPIIPAKNWAPPEVLSADANSMSYTMKSDIYSMSIVLVEVSCCCRHPSLTMLTERLTYA
jgi:hypothetical protein